MKNSTYHFGFSILNHHHNHLSHIVILVMIWMVNLFSTQTAFAQVTGDYRSIADGNWTVLTNWERWDGSAWVIPTAPQGYPGQNAGTQTVTIQNDNQVVLNISPGNLIEYLVIGSS